MDTEMKCLPSPYAFAGMKRGKEVSTQIRVSHIIDAICEEYSTTLESISILTRDRDKVECRKMIMLFLRKFTTMSLKQVGNYLGGFDHTTVIHGIKTINNRIDTEELLAVKRDKIDADIWRRLNDSQQ